MLHLTVSEWGDVSGQQEELRVTAEAFGSSSDVTKQHGGPAGTMTSSSGYETPRACALEHSQPHISLNMGPDFFLKNVELEVVSRPVFRCGSDGVVYIFWF